MTYKLFTIGIMVSLLLLPSPRAKAMPPTTTIYLPVVTNAPTANTVDPAAQATLAAPGYTFYLPLVTQEQAEVSAAWLGWPDLFPIGANNFSVKIEKRHFDAGGDGEPFNFLQIPLLIELYNQLTVPDYAVKKVWGIQNAQLDKAQTIAKGTGVIIAVVDTGLTPFSLELLLRSKVGYDFVDNNSITLEAANWWDDDRDGQIDEGVGHGTFISSIIAASTRDTRLLPVRVLNSDGSGTAETVAKGIRYAADRGADIINLSLSGQNDEPVLRAAIEYAAAKGVVLIAAAASSSATVGYPAAYPQVIAVGAITQSNAVATFARANADQIDVFAPGEEIYGLSNLGRGIWMSGNSMAAAFVSAAAALLMQNDHCQAACVRAALTGQVNAVSPSQNGRGRIDAYQAVLNTR